MGLRWYPLKALVLIFGLVILIIILKTIGLSVDESGNKLKDDKGNQIVNYGLKTKYKNQFNAEAAGLLAKTDWYVIKAADVTSYSVPSNITTYRAAVRTKVNSM